MLPDTRIHITGASGSGTTTLGSSLAGWLNGRLFESDDYLWLPTDPPYQTQRPAAGSRTMMMNDLTSRSFIEAITDPSGNA